jgi:ribonuclease HII
MQSVLSFPKEHKEKLKKILAGCERKETKSEYEEFRCVLKGCTITIYHTGRLVIQGTECEKIKEMLLKEMNLSEQLFLGFDETGRGERTGPFVIAAVLGDANSLLELRDSKKTSNINEKYKVATRNSLANASFSFNSRYIDTLRARGFTMNEIEAKALEAIARAFDELGEKTEKIVDGSEIKTNYNGFKFIEKADDKNTAVSAASIVSKFTRDSSADNSERKSWLTKDKK